MLSPRFAPIAQWIEQLRPKVKIYVRVVVGAPKVTTTRRERVLRSGRSITKGSRRCLHRERLNNIWNNPTPCTNKDALVRLGYYYLVYMLGTGL